jgi:hypothetical protein
MNRKEDVWGEHGRRDVTGTTWPLYFMFSGEQRLAIFSIVLPLLLLLLALPSAAVPRGGACDSIGAMCDFPLDCVVLYPGRPDAAGEILLAGSSDVGICSAVRGLGYSCDPTPATSDFCVGAICVNSICATCPACPASSPAPGASYDPCPGGDTDCAGGLTCNVSSLLCVPQFVPAAEGEACPHGDADCAGGLLCLPETDSTIALPWRCRTPPPLVICPPPQVAVTCPPPPPPSRKVDGETVVPLWVLALVAIGTFLLGACLATLSLSMDCYKKHEHECEHVALDQFDEARTSLHDLRDI